MTQQLAAEFFADRGWPTASSTAAFLSGRDITGIIGVAPEVKATATFPLAGMRQAEANAGRDLPCLIWRPNGYGPERIDEWVFAVTLGRGAVLLRDAGY